MIFGGAIIEKLIIEAARATWWKTATKCVLRDDFVQIQDDTGKPLHTTFRHQAPDYVLQDLRQSVRH